MTVEPAYDIAIIGAGLAGLSLAARLAEAPFAALRVLVLEFRTGYRRDRTWSYWSIQPHPFQAAVSASWDRWRIVAPHRTVTRAAPGLRYESIQADRLYHMALERIRAAPHITLCLGVTVQAEEDAQGVRLWFGDRTARARLAFDARPPRALGGRGLTQRFLGWEVECRDDVFDASAATLMDFRGMKPGAVNFTYVLPSTGRRALIEDTWFAPHEIRPPDHHAAMRAYLRVQFGVTRFEILHEERGALPMDPVFRPVPGKRLLPIGTAGGAARPSTGYAFTAIQTQCDRIAADLLAARMPHPPTMRPGIVRLMDHVLLDMLDRHPDLAPSVFATLFDRCEPRMLARFLDDRASLGDLARVGLAMPVMATSRASLHLILERIRCTPTGIAG